MLSVLVLPYHLWWNRTNLLSVSLSTCAVTENCFPFSIRWRFSSSPDCASFSGHTSLCWTFRQPINFPPYQSYCIGERVVKNTISCRNSATQLSRRVRRTQRNVPPLPFGQLQGKSRCDWPKWRLHKRSTTAIASFNKLSSSILVAKQNQVLQHSSSQLPQLCRSSLKNMCI